MSEDEALDVVGGHLRKSFHDSISHCLIAQRLFNVLHGERQHEKHGWHKER